MAGLVALAIILLAAVQVQSELHRRDANDMRLNDLQAELDELKHLMDERIAHRDQRLIEFAELRARASALKENKCGHREFHCKNSEVTCIHDMLVCDGANDCPDGCDEQECDNPAHAGTSFEGPIYNSSCRGDISAHHFRIDILGETKYNYFPSISVLDVLITIDHKIERHLKALYSYGQKALISYDQKKGGNALRCRFETDHSRFCTAEFLSLITMEVCGHAILISHDLALAH